MRTPKKKSEGGPGVEPANSGSHAMCSTCTLLGGVGAILVLIAVVVAVVILTGPNTSGNSEPAVAGLTPVAVLDGACPSAGVNALRTGEFSHYVQIVYDIQEGTANCSVAAAINAATANATGTDTSAMIISIEEGAARRLDSESVRSKSSLRQLRRRGRVVQTILATNAGEADEVAERVSQAAEDGTLSEILDRMVIGARLTLLEEADEAITFGVFIDEPQSGSDDEVRDIQ